MQGGEQRLLDPGVWLPVAVDLPGRRERDQLPLDPRHLVPLAVLEDQLVAEAEHLAVDVEDIPPLGVLDREVVPDRNELLSHHVAHRGPSWRSSIAVQPLYHALIWTRTTRTPSPPWTRCT